MKQNGSQPKTFGEFQSYGADTSLPSSMREDERLNENIALRLVASLGYLLIPPADATERGPAS